MGNENIRYAGFGVRFLASLIDSVVLAVFLMIIGIGLAMIFKSHLETMTAAQLSSISSVVWIKLIFFLVAAFLFPILFWRKYDATPGKMIFKMKVVDADNFQKLSFSKGFIRCIGYFVSSLILCLGYLWVIFDKRKQGWHDKMANSVVIYKN